MSISLDLPWTVDAEKSVTDEFSGEIIVTDHSSGIPFTCSFDPKDPSSEEEARQRALVICRRFNADLPDSEATFWLYACTVSREFGGPEEGGWYFDRTTPIPEIPAFPIDLKRTHCDQRESTAAHDYLMRAAAALGYLPNPRFRNVGEDPDVTVEWRSEPDWQGTPTPHYE